MIGWSPMMSWSGSYSADGLISSQGSVEANNVIIDRFFPPKKVKNTFATEIPNAKFKDS